MPNKLYYFKSKSTGKKRNTPVVAPNVKSAKKKLKRPSATDAVVYKVRTPNATEKKQIKKGSWITTRSSGKSRMKDKRGKGFFGRGK